MKNIHVLPTDKPSRLAVSEYITNVQGIDKRVFKFKLWNKFIDNKDLKAAGYIPHNIYITSDEEIKEGDWFVNLISKELLRCFRNSAVKSLGGKTINNTEKWLDNNKCKKIILTTDQDLIKDGVQAIDDEFLEWFVKNPSCEFVEVQNQYRVKSGTIQEHKDGLAGYEYYEYKIIIPQEEPKLTFEEYEQQGLEKYSHELKQETLEEAAERFRSKNPGTMQGGNNTKILNAFKAGAEWQSDKMYSEGEVEKIAKELFFTMANCDKDIIHKESDFDKWFEKFKKK